MTKEELEKELEKLKDFKLYVFEGEVYVKAEDYKKIAIENKKLNEEIESLKLHIEAKDKAYMSLLKDYEKLKESSETKEETLIKAIGDIFNKLKD